MMQAHWEHFEHGADVGVRGLAAAKAGAFEQAALAVTREGAMRVPGIVYASRELMRAMDDKVREQVRNVATLQGIVGASFAMPDARWGYGFPIGSEFLLRMAAEAPRFGLTLPPLGARAVERRRLRVGTPRGRRGRWALDAALTRLNRPAFALPSIHRHESHPFRPHRS